MGENGNGLTFYMEEQAKTVFDLDETLRLLREGFPLRTSNEEFQKAVAKRAQALQIEQECFVKEILIPKFISQSGKALNHVKQSFSNWWSGKVTISRDSAVEIAFALEMDVETAKEFLTHSCGHHSFYLRDYKDLIYVFCLDKGLGYKKAMIMIEVHAEPRQFHRKLQGSELRIQDI